MEKKESRLKTIENQLRILRENWRLMCKTINELEERVCKLDGGSLPKPPENKPFKRDYEDEYGE